jgi:serine/threonine-protein kinase
VRPIDATEVAGEIARLRSEVSLREKLKGHMQRHPQWSAGLAVLFTLLVAGGAYWGMGRLLETPAPSEAETYYARGVHYLREESETVRSVDDAILQFHRAIQADSLFAPAWAGMAEAYWSRYTLDRRDASLAEAMQVEARAVELAPDLAETRVARARGLYARGDYEGVEPALGNASRDREVGYMALGYAGLAHLALGEFDEAEKDLEEVVRRRPDSHRSWLYLGKYHQDRGEYGEAAAAFQEAADLKPDSPYAWANLGASLLYQGRFEDAIPPLERSLRIDENAVARTNLGTAYYSLGDLDRAIEHYRIAAKTEPYRGIYWANLGDALITADRATEAGDAYKEAVAAGLETVRLTPGNMAAHSLLGLWAARVGDRRTAFEHAGLAVEAQNQNPSFIFNLAVVNVIFGEDEEGLGLLRKAVVEMGVSRSDLDLEPAFEQLRDDDRFRAIYDLSS